MAIVDLVMPKLGESIMEATILKWYKNPGDYIKMDETVLDIATDKVDSEIPSSVEGILEEALYSVNDVVPVGEVIARIRTSATNGRESSHSAPPPPEKQPEARNESYQQQPPVKQYNSTGNNHRFYSPLV